MPGNLFSPVDLDEVLEEEDNMLVRLDYAYEYREFCVWVYLHRTELAETVSYHLNLRNGSTCTLGEVRDWLCGGFNLCIPVHVSERERPDRRVLLRLPLPYKIGGVSSANIEEKIRTEAATYIWLQQWCPDIPIPLLWGFGIPKGRCFSNVKSASFTSWLLWLARAGIAFVSGRQRPNNYLPCPRRNDLECGYVVTDWIEKSDGEMLQTSWEEKRGNVGLRANLSKSLAQILLSLHRHPQPRIGSWTIDDQGQLSLTNRPLLHHLYVLENEGVDTFMPRDQTYSTSSALYSALLNGHDSRLRMQPNSVNDEEDGKIQMANLFAMRGLQRQYADRALENGPFFVTLTDLRPTNLFVDSDWNIKFVIDLEWAASLPDSMSALPHWLTGRAIDELGDEHKKEFERVFFGEFLKILETEELSMASKSKTRSLSETMRHSWDTAGFFFFQALRNVKACHNLLHDHLLPLYEASIDLKAYAAALSVFWSLDSRETLVKKLADRQAYRKALVDKVELVNSRV